MKITTEVILSVMSANEKPSMDGKTSYYNLAVMQDGEVANVSCTEEVRNDVLAILRPNMIMPFRFKIAVDVTYKTVKLVALLPDNDNSPRIGGGDFDGTTATAENPADNKTGAKADNKTATK